MTFSISLLSVFNRTIGLNILEVSYNILLDLGIIIDIDTLKCKGQYSKLIYALAIFKTLSRHAKFLMISLRCFQDNLLSLGVKLLLHLLIANKNSSSEKGGYWDTTLLGISSRIEVSICQCWAVLNDL